MKKVLITLAIPFMLAACGGNENKDTAAPAEIMADTTTNFDNNANTDTGATVIKEEAPVETKKSTSTTTHKVTAPVKKAPAPATTAPVTATPEPKTSTTTTTSTTQPVAAPVEEKKGWSHAAKDAVIGGSAGAIGGAIIGKKKVKSAAIGAAVGAAGGYILGRKKDKKDTLR